MHTIHPVTLRRHTQLRAAEARNGMGKRRRGFVRGGQRRSIVIRLPRRLPVLRAPSS